MSELRRVLLVEDDPDIAVLAGIAIRDFGGLEFFHAASGPDALGQVEKVAPDLIILDYRLPGMTGAEILDRLRNGAATSAIPVVFMTASLMPDHVEKLKSAGALEVLPKPFDPVTLAEELRRIWSSARSQA